MTKIPLPKYLETNSQTDLAESVGLTQGAISKMVLSGRIVFVVLNKSGKAVRLVEEKQVAPLAKTAA